MELVTETDCLGTLDQLDAVEDAAADIPGTLERIDAGPADQDGLLAGRKHPQHAGVLAFAQQAASDCRLRHQRHVKINERVVRRAPLRTPRGLRVAGFGEAVVDLAYGQVQVRDRALVEQFLPACDRAGLRVQGACLGCFARGRGRSRLAAVQAEQSRHPGRRAGDAFPHHQHGHGGAADQVHTRRPGSRRGGLQRVVANEGGQVIDDALFGNADQHDRFAVLDHLDAGDGAGRVEPDQDVDRLAGIPVRVDVLGVQVGITEQLVPPEHLGDRR